MRLFPSPGLEIRNPATRLSVPADGLEVPDVAGVPSDPYWQRLLRDGDVTKVQPVSPSQSETASPTPLPASSDTTVETGKTPSLVNEGGHGA